MSAIRKQAAASFYPGDCRQQLTAFLDGWEEAPGESFPLCGAVVPHAGWLYSGRVAARTLYQLSQYSRPDTCMVFGTDHYGLKQHCLYPDGAWETPLGNLTIDGEVIQRLQDLPETLLRCDERPHRLEHSIEVIAPMIKYFWPRIRMVAILVKHSISASKLGTSIARQIQALDKNFIFIASSDLTHYGPPYGLISRGTGAKAYEWMQQNDRRMISILCSLEVDRVLGEAELHRNACGGGALTAILSTLKARRAHKGYLVEYATSHGNQSPERFNTAVGYAGVVFQT